MKPDTPEKARELLDEALHRGWVDPQLVEIETSRVVDPGLMDGTREHGIQVTSPYSGTKSIFMDIEIGF